MLRKSQILKKELLKVGKFSLVGVVNTVVDYIIFLCAFYLLSLSIALANLLAFLFAVCLSYYLNSKFTFSESSSDRSLTKLLRFILASATAFVLVTIVIYILSDYMPVYLAKILAAGVSLVVNYSLAKLLVFR
ncbi:GtrA family protein [uncultured Pseudoteredinibacter sp.]|uniref:GtrA family protein n=1 Tax=uncultured Pseudoteredinibacter sp. TaxID=1641701 RepID=UPI00344941A2